MPSNPRPGKHGNDADFCRRFTVETGVAVTHFARFSFCKKDEVLAVAIDRLARCFGGGCCPN